MRIFRKEWWSTMPSDTEMAFLYGYATATVVAIIVSLIVTLIAMGFFGWEAVG